MTFLRADVALYEKNFEIFSVLCYLRFDFMKQIECWRRNFKRHL